MASTVLEQYAAIVYGARNATVTLEASSPLAALTPFETRAARVVLYHTWTASVSPVLFWSPSVFNTSWTSESDFGSDDRFYLQNVLNASLLQPGEFMFDPALRVLTYRLAAGERLDSLRLVAPALREVISSTPGATAVTFANVTIAHAAAFLEEDCMLDGCSYQSCADGNLAAVHLHGATDWLLSGVEVAHTGQSGVWVQDACTNVTVSGCWLHDLGAGGVRVGVTASGLLPDPSQLTSQVRIIDNAIEDGGRICLAGTGVLWHTAAVGEIAHNEVARFFYTGVSVGWTWSYEPTELRGMRVEYNAVHDIGQRGLSDLAGIYLVGPQPGTAVHHNLVHSVFAGANGAHALYLDQACAGTSWAFNVAYNAGSSVLQQHYGMNNTLTNNVVAFPTSLPLSPWPCTFGPDCGLAGLRSGKHADGSGEGAISQFAFDHNIVLLDGLAADANATLFTTDVADGLANMSFQSNVYWRLGDKSGASLAFPPSQAPTTFAEWQAQGKDALSLITDPLFADAASFNFTLLHGSPALALGIASIDLTTVGPRWNPRLRRQPRA